jgi:hypothetical protein
MFARLEAPGDHGGMRVMNGQVDDQINRLVCQQAFRCVVSPAAMLGGQGFGPVNLKVGHADQVDFIIGGQIAGVRPGDVAAAYDANAKFIICHELLL